MDNGGVVTNKSPPTTRLCTIPFLKGFVGAWGRLCQKHPHITLAILPPLFYNMRIILIFKEVLWKRSITTRRDGES